MRRRRRDSTLKAMELAIAAFLLGLSVVLFACGKIDASDLAEDVVDSLLDD